MVNQNTGGLYGKVIPVLSLINKQLRLFGCFETCIKTGVVHSHGFIGHYPLVQKKVDQNYLDGDLGDTTVSPFFMLLSIYCYGV